MRLKRFSCCAGVVVAVGLIISCQPAAVDDNAANVATNEQRAEAPALPIAEPPMDREGLVLAAIRAASAQVAGQDDSDAQRTLGGRRFEVRIRFGCPTDPEADQTFAIRLQERPRTLRLRAAPDLTASDPLAAQFAGENVEVIEGFWIRRPWLLTATCPASTDVAEEDSGEVGAPAAEEVRSAAHARIGIAQYFGEGDARTFQRRQRPYEATKSLAEGESPSAEGYDLVLSGRLRRLANGRVINCSAAGPDQPPDCIVSVAYDRVWIERLDGGEIIAEWGRG